MSGIKNEVIYDKDFLKDVRRLPYECQEKLAELLEFLKEDPFDSRLHTKPLGPPLQGAFSFRIGRDYRIGFRFHSEHVIHLLIADHRSRIYKRLSRR